MWSFCCSEQNKGVIHIFPEFTQKCSCASQIPCITNPDQVFLAPGLVPDSTESWGDPSAPPAEQGKGLQRGCRPIPCPSPRPGTCPGHTEPLRAFLTRFSHGRRREKACRVMSCHVVPCPLPPPKKKKKRNQKKTRRKIISTRFFVGRRGILPSLR